MPRLSVRRSGGISTTAVAVLGVGIGLTAGILLRGLLGRVSGSRVRHAVRSATAPTGARQPRRVAEAILAALSADPRLAELPFQVIPVWAGHVELHGWVPSRALGARAIRLAAEAAPDVEVTNRLRVRGEDDAAAPEDLSESLPA